MNNLSYKIDQQIIDALSKQPVNIDISIIEIWNELGRINLNFIDYKTIDKTF
jgi:hypothetical protein